ncbi:MAG: thiol:disulfide interchange protein [Flavobacteriales bacterium]|nr:thiol:disulfide interchange protein [Flavobacteriales bacterium]|tara:strand:- start:14476 stop:14961 length:486 start_codon:yes stop_codon:yes gene_type:complete
MRKCIILVLITILNLSFIGGGNQGKILPSVEFKMLDGTVFNSKKIKRPAVLTFWSTTCVPCIKELMAINSKYSEWKKSTDFEVYAISTDDERYATRVPLIVERKGWQFPILRDKERLMFKALGVSNNPYTVVVDQKGKIVYEHTSYKEGDEDRLIEIIKEL